MVINREDNLKAQLKIKQECSRKPIRGSIMTLPKLNHPQYMEGGNLDDQLATFLGFLDQQIGHHIYLSKATKNPP